MYIVGLVIAIGIMMVAYALLLSIIKISPIRFWKSFLPTFGIAFGTASSNAALPVAIENAQGEFKMKKDIASVDRLTDGFIPLLNVMGNTANAANAVILDKWEEKKNR